MKIKNIDTVVATVKSDTTDDLYEITWSDENGYLCSCPARTKKCKHIKRWKFRQNVKSLFDLHNMDKDHILDSIVKIAKETWEV